MGNSNVYVDLDGPDNGFSSKNNHAEELSINVGSDVNKLQGFLTLITALQRQNDFHWRLSHPGQPMPVGGSDFKGKKHLDYLKLAINNRIRALTRDQEFHDRFRNYPIQVNLATPQQINKWYEGGWYDAHGNKQPPKSDQIPPDRELGPDGKPIPVAGEIVADAESGNLLGSLAGGEQRRNDALGDKIYGGLSTEQIADIRDKKYADNLGDAILDQVGDAAGALGDTVKHQAKKIPDLIPWWVYVAVIGTGAFIIFHEVKDFIPKPASARSR
jgi:hypothetical protein